ncbi:MAG: UDP-N-acetylmuramoyl-tripeptide--D-alanyl-D-alanine ligase [Lachnospiraceae bacterium]|nr:UDP-N-acetylmuramoyl-tripeptide--D-alanyl-D-alanine ligase [Lachnospiraceae bacterium]
MRGMTLEKIAKACGGKLFLKTALKEDELSREAASVVIDSRKAEAGGIFVATKGERVDGHSFIGQVLEKGALGVICEKKPSDEAGNYIVVDDSFEAIKKLAGYYKSLFDIPTIGIVGSMGKTSTKEMVAQVLSRKYRVHKTEGNFNNEIGVPLTIFGLRDEHEISVIEMGISEFGEMSRLSEIVKPDSVVFTNVGPCHLEQLNDLDGVFKAKSEVFDRLTGKGRVFLNGDDPKLCLVDKVKGKEPVFYGIVNTKELDIYADNIVNRQLKGVDARFHIAKPVGSGFEKDSKQQTGDPGFLEECFDVHIPLPGEHSVSNALAGCAVGVYYGLSAEEIRQGIGNVRGLKGRMNPIETKDYLIIDDCYNANPKSMMNALALLSETKDETGIRTVSVLGDMYELGEDSDKLHREVGRFAAEHNIDLILIVGSNSKSMYEEALEARKKEACEGSVLYFEDTDSLIEGLKTDNPFKKGDMILIKASHAMQFERVVGFLSPE